MTRMLYMAAKRPLLAPDSPLAKALREQGELEIVADGKSLTDEQALEKMRQADVIITHWAARRIPKELASDPGNVRYILNLGGTCKATVPIEIIRSKIPVTNWGDTPARAVAEGAMSLLLAVLKDLRPRIEVLVDGKSHNLKKIGLTPGTLYETRVGLYGCGAIGNKFVEMLQPFQPEIHIYDPYTKELPQGCQSVQTLDELFEKSEIIVIWSGLSAETKGSVNAARLARLPDQGIIINAARGEIIDQDALCVELEKGRLRAGLDVLENDKYILEDHPLHRLPNVILTTHNINAAFWPKRPPHLNYGDKVALENIRRFQTEEPLRFVMDEDRYLRSS